MAQTTISVRLDSTDKKRFEEFCNETGMNVSVAINMFVKAVLRENKLPFTVASDNPNQLTLKAFAEGEKMLHDPNTQRFSSIEDLFEELDSWNMKFKEHRSSKKITN